MKGVCFKSVGEVETLEMADPEIQQPTDAILKVTMAGLCGSDLHPVSYTHLTLPTILRGICFRKAKCDYIFW